MDNGWIKLQEFTKKSETFNGFEFSGHYSMSTDLFISLFKHYVETGENCLDDYSEYIYLKWRDVSGMDMCSNDEYEHISKALSRLRRLRIIDPDDLGEQRSKLERLRKNYRAYLSKLRNEPRRKATAHTRKIRSKVFEKYGRKCLCCGATKNLSIDHVVPLSKGGVNDISNYQPLCKSCNSKKGTRKTDYRKKKEVVINE